MALDLNARLQRATAHLPLLTAALNAHATRPRDTHVYTAPAAFEAFIRGGGNVPLYERVSAELARHYTPGTRSLLDIGCGDGHALFPALAQARSSSPLALERLTLVEPATALLASAVARARAEQPALPVQALNEPLGAFAARQQAGTAHPDRWGLAQATFALQAIPEPERWDGLARRRAHVRRLVIVEFDIPADLPRGSDAYVASLAQRYERALGEYEGATRDLVAQGFLIPIFLGQFDAQTAATNWEHPMPVWRDKLSGLGWRVTRLEHLCDYFWAPAFVLVAEA